MEMSNMDFSKKERLYEKGDMYATKQTKCYVCATNICNSQYAKHAHEKIKLNKSVSVNVCEVAEGSGKERKDKKE